MRCRMISIPYRDLSVKDPNLKRELMDAVDKVLSHGRLILGPEVSMLEQEIAKFCNKKFAVGVNSGTDALYFALRALDIGPGDEVITTPLSWIATLNAIVLCGATPVFVDIGEDMNINPALVENAITHKTKAILPVHFTGKMCDMSAIASIAAKNGLKVIEDASQAFGAKIQNKVAGSWGYVNCFSLNAMKILNAYGEAGIIVTDDAHVFDKLTSLRYAGTINKEDCHYPSLNGRIDTIQAAMLLVELKRLTPKINRLQEIARIYTTHLNDIVKCPDDEGSFHVYYSYTILTDRRDELKNFLLEKGIETKIQHPILMPYHAAYKQKFKPYIPMAEKIVNQILCLPNHEKLTNEDVRHIVETVKFFFR